jgi:choline dehydrogenase-like flavoprotein
VPSSLIIGSGPAAAGVALSLARQPDQQITVIDVGGVLEDHHRDAVVRLSTTEPEAWPREDLELIRKLPVGASRASLPEKRAYGSDFPFRDFGQLAGVKAEGRTNKAVVSGAFGGFSNVWGAQVMPFTSATFDRWPIKFAEIEPHYREILHHIPFVGADDDLSELFPLLVEPNPPPDLAARTNMVLGAYARRRAQLRRLGVVVGQARLALHSTTCISCGMCMTGCPYSLIYSASQTFDELRHRRRIDYHSGLLAVRLEQSEDQAVVVTREPATGQTHRFIADRVFVACGALGTTRLVLGSFPGVPRRITMSEAAQFVVPTLSRRGTPDPRQVASFTLNQFNMVIDLDREGFDVSLVHFYPYNPAFLEALPKILKSGPGARAGAQLLRHLSVGLGYLPSWASPRLTVRTSVSPTDGLPDIVIGRESSSPWIPPMLLRVMSRMMQAAPHLDLWPILPKVFFSPGAKSHHFGGSFPHRHGPAVAATADVTTDRLGRLPAWNRIHLVDASVFPSVPATTFTLTIMANAHRIAEETLAIRDA